MLHRQEGKLALYIVLTHYVHVVDVPEHFKHGKVHGEQALT